MMTCSTCGYEQEFVKEDHTVQYGDDPEWDVVKVRTRRDPSRFVEVKVARCCKCGYRAWYDEDGIQRIMKTADEEIDEVDLFNRVSELYERDKMRKLST